MKPKGTPITRTEIRDRIRSAGLRATSARIIVYERLLQAQAPVSHPELADALEPLGFDRATVYRNLVDLAEAGLASRTDLGDHVWRFEAKGQEGPHSAEHPHFVCSDCGQVACLPEVGIRITAPSGTFRSVRTRAVEVQLRGLCDECA